MSSEQKDSAAGEGVPDVLDLQAQILSDALWIHRVGEHDDENGIVPIEKCPHPRCIRSLKLSRTDFARMSPVTVDEAAARRAAEKIVDAHRDALWGHEDDIAEIIASEIKESK